MLVLKILNYQPFNLKKILVYEYISQIVFPDFEIVGMKKIHACLRKFGLNDDEFTLAPAIGGILVYDIKQGLFGFQTSSWKHWAHPFLNHK